MTIRARVFLALTLLVTIAAAGVVVAGVLSWTTGGDSAASEAADHIDDAEHDRLLATCLAAADEPIVITDSPIRPGGARINEADCPTLTNMIVEAMNEHGCSYDDATRLLAAVLTGDATDIDDGSLCT